jgi:Heparinase II/III-like protein/Heparinase II/III N-terminus
MRSIKEITFRVRQEAANLYLWLARPEFTGEAPEVLALPSHHAVVEALRGSEYAASVEAIANNLLAHRFPLLGVTIDTGKEIHWRRDYMHGKESGLDYFRRIPYLDFAAIGDHKFIWELNRHQHLVLLAQAYQFTGNAAFANEVFTQLESWLEQNPFQRGINWASALEVAFRALSWIWIYHLVADKMQPDFKRRFLSALYQHGLHLSENLSVYFSPNTHLLGEAVALHAIGTLFSGFRGAKKWRKVSAEIVRGQLAFQVKSDGSHFEQSSYYHVYALDLFLFFYLMDGRPREFEPALLRMADYLHWLLGSSRSIACFGDDDGGRLFHPYGSRNQFGRATLTTCGILFEKENWMGPSAQIAEQAAWWLGVESLARARAQQAIPPGGRLFKDSGALFLQCGDLSLQMDAGPFGWAGAGHSHADTLSIVLWRQGAEVLVDPGTFTYIGDPAQRNWFRGTPAHNTICIDGMDQASSAGPFRWATKPEVQLTAWGQTAEGGFADAVCRYAGFTHRRRVLLEAERLLVLDEMDGPAGEHTCRQNWQLGAAADRVRFVFSDPAVHEPSQISHAYGEKKPSTALAAKTSRTFPLSMFMMLRIDGESEISLAEARAIFDQKAVTLSNLKCQTQSPDKLEEALYAVKGTSTFE